MKRLIINADDYGLTAACDRAILGAIKDGAVTSASCMVFDRQPAVPPALYQRCGVHLRLTGGGRPLSPADLVPSLVNQRGCFPDDALMVFTRGVNPDEVWAEWDAQIKAFRGTGNQPSHLDSHHHAHGWTTLWEVYAALCVQHSAPGVPLSDGQRSYLRRRSVRCADFAEVRWTDGAPWTLLFLLAEDFEVYDTVHLMTHPGVNDDELKSISTMTAVREAECKALAAPEVQEWFRRREIEVIGYAAL